LSREHDVRQRIAFAPRRARNDAVSLIIHAYRALDAPAA
jgi:hypothetical protein